MRATFRLGILVSTSSILLSGLFGCNSDELEGAKAEVVDNKIQLDLPAVPDFKMPKPNPDGSHPVAEMRLKGNAYLDTEVKVKGVVLWIYDCATAVRTPEMSEDDVKKLLETQPDRCTRPHFVMGDTRESKTERGIMVVEYPRPLRKDEKKALDKEIIKEREAALALLPAFKVGDEVMVTGKWALKSPLGFQSSDGLLVYQTMENLSAPTDAEE
jgi:hypothetical protein